MAIEVERERDEARGTDLEVERERDETRGMDLIRFRLAKRATSLAVLVSLLVSIALPASAQETAAPKDEAPKSEAASSEALSPEVESIMLECGRLAEQIEDLTEAGKSEEAIPIARKALELAQKVEDSQPEVVVAAIDRLAIVLAMRGEYGEAKSLYARAQSIYEKKLGPDDPANAVILMRQASLASREHDYAAAEPLLRRALTITQKAADEDKTQLVAANRDLAHVVAVLGKESEALGLYKSAQDIQEKFIAANPPDAKPPEGKQPDTKQVQASPLDLADILNDHASVLVNLGRVDEATPLLQRALGILEDSAKTADKEKRPVAKSDSIMQCLNNLAAIYISQQKFAQAKPLLIRAVAGYEHSGIESNLDRAHALTNLGYAQASQDESANGEEHLTQAASLLDQYFMQVLPGLSFGEQREFIEKEVPGETALLLSFCRSAGSFPKAYNLMLRWKGLLVAYLQHTNKLSEASSDNQTKQATSKLQAIRSSLAESYFRYLALSADKCLEWKNEYERLTFEKEAAERDLALLLREENQKQSVPLGALDLQKIQSNFDDHTALVDFYLYLYTGTQFSPGFRYAAIVSTKNAPPKLVELGPAGLVDKAINSWRSDVIHITGTTSQSWSAVTAAVWAPIVSQLPQGTSKVWVCPDGELSRIPWQLVVDEKVKDPMEVCQSDSPRELAHLLQSQNVAPPAGVAGLLVVSGIDFDANLDGGSKPADGQNLLALHALPGTSDEAKIIESLAKSKSMLVRELTGAAATKSAVVADLEKSAYAHLATHGFFFDESMIPELSPRTAPPGSSSSAPVNANPATPPAGGSNSQAPPVVRTVEVVKAYAKAKTANRNPLVESGIALAGANNLSAAKGKRSGLITAEELIGIDLNGCKLLTLSACETGRGKEVVGQGVLGLRASLMAAGAHCILMSLWRVPDTSTAQLMTDFYTNLWTKNMKPVAALREAQKSVKNTPQHHFEDPVNWAGWVVIGE